MIAPHELKNKTFSRVVRGYNPLEVDEYFDFLIEKYTIAYKQIIDLEQKYSQIESLYNELSNEEESIRSTILKAKKLGEAIVNNAEKDIKAREEEHRKLCLEKEEQLEKKCAEILEKTKRRVDEEKENILKLRKLAIDFQDKLYDDYVKHIQLLKSIQIDKTVDVDSLCRMDLELPSHDVSDHVKEIPIIIQESEHDQYQKNR